MKLQLELNIDWIDEDMTLDETVKHEIIEKIVGKLFKTVELETESKVNQLIDKKVMEIIDKKTNETYEDFLSKPVSITDSYGDTIETFENVSKVIKSRFDNFLLQTVDKDGKATDSSWTKKGTRLEHIIDGRLRVFADKFTTDAVNRVSAEIKEHVEQGLTQKLGSELMKVLKVDQMLKLESKR